VSNVRAIWANFRVCKPRYMDSQSAAGKAGKGAAPDLVAEGLFEGLRQALTSHALPGTGPSSPASGRGVYRCSASQPLSLWATRFTHWV